MLCSIIGGFGLFNLCTQSLSFTDKETERSTYKMRMEGCSSGRRVSVTLGDDNPVVVAIHSETGVRTDALNKGALCGPSYRGHDSRRQTI